MFFLKVFKEYFLSMKFDVHKVHNYRLSRSFLVASRQLEYILLVVVFDNLA